MGRGTTQYIPKWQSGMPILEVHWLFSGPVSWLSQYVTIGPCKYSCGKKASRLVEPLANHPDGKWPTHALNTENRTHRTLTTHQIHSALMLRTHSSRKKIPRMHVCKQIILRISTKKNSQNYSMIIPLHKLLMNKPVSSLATAPAVGFQSQASTCSSNGRWSRTKSLVTKKRMKSKHTWESKGTPPNATPFQKIRDQGG